ncbi:variable large family protein (plasmid) [Borrelia coriaceae]|uniref:variable large family protein n=1 Tax=Borrelia coriaceae TaxID=144 RepID=UPI0031BBB5E7|nr:variable large family protein [Borrelia coriaceae]
MKINIKNIRVKSICATLFISLFLSCNNGIEELQKQNQSILSISNLRQIFLDVFASFGDMLKDPFGITAATTKKSVGEQLGKVGEAVKSAKSKLESIKSGSGYDLIKDKAETLIAKAIKTLKKIVNGTNKIKEATKDADDQIANAGSSNADAVKADETSVKNLVKGISMVYEASKDADVAPKGDARKATGSDCKAVGKLFGTNGSLAGSELKAANVALNVASGADILAAIEAANKDGQEKPASTINLAKDAYDIAIANNSGSNDAEDAAVKQNASVIVAGLALKAMARGGKLAINTTHAPQEGVNAVLSRAVGKTVSEIVFTIRRTVDKCLKDVSECIKENSTSNEKSK